MVYRALMAGRAWFPTSLDGQRVVLRRHVPENLDAFRRWYTDPEIARLARYTEGPMRPEEVDRFFQTRAIGPDSLAMAIHEKVGNRLIGTCALSQLDGENGSALFHITIGEQDAWGRGYGTEATRLMIAHAFGGLGLHRVSLSVFAFNERAIRAYARCGFIVEGRAREAIWRDGTWWDEVSMSILDAEWRRLPANRADRSVAAESTTDESIAASPAVAGPDNRERRAGGVIARIMGR